MRARALGWLAAGAASLALLAGCAGADTPAASGDTSASAAPTGPAPSGTAATSVVTDPVTLPATDPGTQPVTEPVTAPPTAAPTDPPTTVPAGPPTVAPRGATRVIVLNAGFKDGGASATADGLTAIGYQVLTPENAYEDRKQSAVYFRDGWEASAREIAESSGISQDLVAPMPGQEISATDPREYDVAVLLGRDRR